MAHAVRICCVFIILASISPQWAQGRAYSTYPPAWSSTSPWWTSLATWASPSKTPIKSRTTDLPRASVSNVRLFGGPSPQEGWVQVYSHGRWMYVCGLNFGEVEADVVCRGGGYPTGNTTFQSVYNYASKPIAITTCSGGEQDLDHCTVHEDYYGYRCNHHSAWVECENKIRLVNGSDMYSGRVEVYYHGQWGTVCDDYFNYYDARVVCRMLNLTDSYSNVASYGLAHYGQGGGKIIVDDLKCQGYEEDIKDCASIAWFSSDCHHYEDAGVDCKPTTAVIPPTGLPRANVSNVRLFGGPSPQEGWVQVYSHGQWMYVCGLNFGEAEADVVCRGGGYPTGNSTFQAIKNYASRPIAITTCSGREQDLDYCTVREVYYGDKCSHYSAWVECENKIRLVNGPDMYAGRVEVYYHGQWGTVCDDSFDYEDALVVCGMLNMNDSDSDVAAYGSAHYGQGRGEIIVDDLNCQGYEDDIKYCDSRIWLSSNCNHGEDAGVDCKNASVRLVNGFDRGSGRVEIYHNGVWHSVCDRHFGHSEAKIICKQLGTFYGEMYGTVFTSSRFGRGTGRSLDQIQCNGYEQNITECNFNGWQANHCSHSEDVGIDCSGYYVEYTTGAYQQTTQTYVSAVRLVDGHEGLVEVYANGRWGTICNYYFGRDEAELICRYLGYPTNNVLYSPRYDGTHVALSYLKCYGGETNINQCYFHEGYSYTYCSGNYKAWVGCQNKIRLVNGPDIYSGRVEVYYNGQWGTVCDDYFDRNDAMVICRMLNLTDNYSDVIAYGSAHFGYGSGEIIVDSLRCTGYESDISDCPSDPWPEDNCSHGEDAGVDCRGLQHTTESVVTEVTDQGTPVRLVNGSDRFSGRLEVYRNGAWRSVCSQDFGHNEAKVICRQLGIYYGNSYGRVFTSYRYGTGQLSAFEGIRCNGYEYDISGCYSHNWNTGTCSHYYDVGVDCRGYWGHATTRWYYTRSTVPSVPSVSSTVAVSCDENGWRIDLDLHQLRQIYPSAVASDIYLGENSCTGIEYFGRLSFHQGLQQCLTTEIMRNDVLVYSNELIYAQHDPNHPFIIKSFNWTVPVECDVERNATSHGHLHHIDHSVTAEPAVVGHSKYSVNMTFYRDPNFAYEIRGNPLQVQVGSNVYVKVFTQTSDWNIKMRVHTCFTKPSGDAPDHMKYYIIKNGCEVDSNTHLLQQHSHETRFVFQDFEYTTNHEGINLYCDANFCDPNDYSRTCSQTCHSVVKRNAQIKDP